MLRKILSIAGRPGLYELVNRGKNTIIIQQLGTTKRMPAFLHDKIVSLGDISIYTTDEDKPLPEVFELIGQKTGLQPVDIKGFGGDAKMREYFGEIVTDYDADRVYNNDIKKIFQWYNALLAAGITKFVEEEHTEAEETAKEGE